MFTINTFALSKLNNAEFVGYCVNLSNLVERAEASKLGLETELVSQFTAVKQKLIDQVYSTVGSQYTAEMKAADIKRDKIYKRIQLKIQIICEAEEGSQMLQFKDRLEASILSKYNYAVMSMAQQAESAVLQGFIHDMRAFFTEDDLDDMGLATDLTNLESANQEFIAAYANRTDERAASDIGLTVKLRTQMQEIIAQLCFTVQYLANSLVEANADKAAACQSFIASLNVVLADVKKRWNQRTSGVEVSDEQVDPNGDAGNGSAGGGSANGGNTSGNGGSNPGGNNGGNTSGGNTQGGVTDIDHENGTEHDGTLEF